MMKGFKLFKIGLFSLLIAFPRTSLGQELIERKIDGKELHSTKHSLGYIENHNKLLKQRAVIYNQSRKSRMVSSRIDNPVGTCNVITCGSFNNADTEPIASWGGFLTAIDGSTYAANVAYDCWQDSGTLDYSEGQYISYSNSNAALDTPAIISPSPDGGGFSIFSYKNETLNQTLTVLPNTVYTACFEIAVIPRYSNDDGSYIEFTPNLQFGINSGGVQITNPLTYTHNDLNIQPLTVFPTELSTNPTGPFQNPGDGTTGWTEINPYWETVCINFRSDASGSVNIFYQTGNPGRSVVLVDGLRLALEGFANSPELTIDTIVTNNGTDTFCDSSFSVDLNDYVTSTSPSCSILTWTTNSDLLDSNDHLSNTIVTNSGVYYVFYYNPIDTCASPAAVLTIEISDLSVQLDSTTNAHCSGNNNGSLTVSGSGGAEPYTYSLDNIDFSNTSGSFDNFTQGNYTVYVQDSNNCIANIEVTIELLDNENPTASNPDPITVECIDDVPLPNINVVIDESDDNTTNPTVEFVSDTSDGNTCPEIITRTYSVTDDCGNSINVIQTITIHDTIAPTFNESLPIDLDVDCNAVPLAATLTADDNCGTAIVTFEEERIDVTVYAGCPNGYRLFRTWTATDECGLTTEHVQKIEVHDTTAPTFNGTLPDVAITAECDAVPTAATLTASDNCASATVTFAETREDGSCDSAYVLTRTWTATDGCGLETEHLQKVMVQDTVGPVLSDLSDTEITVVCGDIPDVPVITAVDSCSVDVQLDYQESSTDSDENGNYVITRNWIFSDACGNETSFEQIVNVELIDITTSVSSIDICIEDISIDLSSYLVGNTDDDGTWTDDNSSGGLSGSDFDPSIVNIGSHQFTYTSSDETCNTTVSIIINVNDDCVVLPCSVDDVENEDIFKISKVITPNFDSVNDVFKVEGLEDCGFTFEVRIFNRWGKMVFESLDYQNETGWNGRNFGGMTLGTKDELPTGTYYYTVNAVGSGAKPRTSYIYLGNKN